MGAVLPDETSRYMLAEEVELEDGTLFWTAPAPVQYLGLPDDILHIVSTGDTLFTIAMHYFIRLQRPEQYYWVIMDYQPIPIADPIAPLAVGRQLVIPSLRTLQQVILNEDRRHTDPHMLLATIDR